MRSAFSSCVGGLPEGTVIVGATPAVPAGERSAAGIEASADELPAPAADVVVVVDAGLDEPPQAARATSDQMRTRVMKILSGERRTRHGVGQPERLGGSTGVARP